MVVAETILGPRGLWESLDLWALMDLASVAGCTIHTLTSTILSHTPHLFLPQKDQVEIMLIYTDGDEQMRFTSAHGCGLPVK